MIFIIKALVSSYKSEYLVLPKNSWTGSFIDATHLSTLNATNWTQKKTRENIDEIVLDSAEKQLQVDHFVLEFIDTCVFADEL